MVKRAVSTFAACIFVAVALVSCSGDRVIPRGKMSKIYAEMLLRDQWIFAHSETTYSADTSFVYKEIIEKYGYTEADYRKSVDYYIQDSERYARILKKSAGILEKRHKKLSNLKSLIDSLSVKVDYNMASRGLKQLSNVKDRNNSVVGEAVFFVDSIPCWDWTIDPSRGWDTLWRGPMLDADTAYLNSIQLDTCSISTK